MVILQKIFLKVSIPLYQNMNVEDIPNIVKYQRTGDIVSMSLDDHEVVPTRVVASLITEGFHTL